MTRPSTPSSRPTCPLPAAARIAALAASAWLAIPAFAQPNSGGGAPSTPAPSQPSGPGGAPGSGGIALEPVKPYTNVEKSQLRERCLSMLQDMARSDSALLRANAIEGMQSTPARCEPLVRAGLADDNLGVRFASAMTVGRLKLASSVPMVQPLLRDADPSVRAAAVFALAKNNVEVDQTELSSMLMAGPIRARANAAYILGELGNKSAAPMLRDAARAPLDGESGAAARLYRLQLAEALVKLGDKSANDTVEAALYPSNRDDFEAAVLAAQIIGEVKNEKAAGQLVNLIEMQPGGAAKTADPRKATFLQPRELRLAAAASMAKLGYYGGWYVGDTYIADEEPAVRAQAAFVLGAAANKSTVNPSVARLEKLLDDQSTLVQCSAAASLLKLLDRSK